jgi:hypothetical protein
MMSGALDCGAGDLLAYHEPTLKAAYELCLFSKNCGKPRKWLSYSCNCQATEA